MIGVLLTVRLLQAVIMYVDNAKSQASLAGPAHVLICMCFTQEVLFLASPIKMPGRDCTYVNNGEIIADCTVDFEKAVSQSWLVHADIHCDMTVT